jgi:phage shock protein PspC (stress-responsive transcriptional regulator)
MADGLPTPLVRPRLGRWLGGVCAGLAARWQLPVARVRAGFVIAAACFGLGFMVYVAAWLILPGESEDGVTPGQRGIVLLAQAGGALFGLAALAGAGAVATIFSFGWVIVALAGAILVGVLAGWARLGPAWALLPIGALVLPSAALAISGVRVAPSTDAVTVAPRDVGELDHYVSGLGTLTLDLRNSAWPAEGEVEVRIDAGMRRTLIALPHDRCVHVNVSQHNPPVVLRAGAMFLGEHNLASPLPTVFGQLGAWTDGQAAQRNDRTAALPGPTLAIDYRTMGGELVVRDYPDDVDPRSFPDWPGYQVYPEERPDTTGLSRSEARRLQREWERRHTDQVADAERVNRLLYGPCAEKAR